VPAPLYWLAVAAQVVARVTAFLTLVALLLLSATWLADQAIDAWKEEAYVLAIALWVVFIALALVGPGLVGLAVTL
jgi:hypothetical protein